VTALSEQHRDIVSNADMQLKSLINLAARLEQIDSSLQLAGQSMGANSSALKDLVIKVASLSLESSALRFEIKDAMTSLATKLDANATLATEVVQKLEMQAGDLRTSASEVISKLAAHTDSSGLVAQRLSEATTITRDVAQQLHGISSANTEVVADAGEAAKTASIAVQLSNQASQTAKDAAESAGKTATQVVEVAGQMQALDTFLRLQTDSLLDAANKLCQSQETQSLNVANAVLNAMATCSASASDVVSSDDIKPVDESSGSNGKEAGLAFVPTPYKPLESMTDSSSKVTAANPYLGA
jgi:hypothetical protein